MRASAEAEHRTEEPPPSNPGAGQQTGEHPRATLRLRQQIVDHPKATLRLSQQIEEHPREYPEPERRVVGVPAPTQTADDD
jgi:hypothetical protein